MQGQTKPNIVARMNQPSANPSGRAYVHGYGLSAFDKMDLGKPCLLLANREVITNKRIFNALDHYQRVWSNTYEMDHENFGDPATNGRTHRFKFIIGIVWGNDEGDKMIDAFGYKLTPTWPGNPEIYNWTFKNGVLIPEPSQKPSGLKNITCGDGIIIMGEEEKYRRKCRALYDYTGHPPDIEGLKLLADVTSC